MGLAIIYAPVFPGSYWIASLALLLQFGSDKWMALRRCRRPRHLNDDTAESVGYLLRGFYLVQICLSYRVYFRDDSRSAPAFIASIIIWGVAMIVPILKSVGVKSDDEGMAEGTDAKYGDLVGASGGDDGAAAAAATATAGGDGRAARHVNSALAAMQKLEVREMGSRATLITFTSLRREFSPSNAFGLLRLSCLLQAHRGLARCTFAHLIA